MGLIRNVFLGSTLAARRLTGFADAQNTTLPEHCDGTIKQVADGGVFNSTGTGKIEFALQDDQNPLEPWYMTQALRDVPLNERGTRGTQAQTIFVSVPESFVGSEQANRTQVCAYRMVGLNATASDDGSCKEMLSDECLKEIDAAPAMLADKGDCPSLEVRDACDHIFFLATSRPFNFSSPACSVSDLPGADLPDGYRTFTGIGTITHTNNQEPEEDSYDMYNLRVRQPVPVLIKARLGGSGSIAYQRQKMLCVAPSNLVQGSREPEGDFPPSSATGLQRGRAVVMALAVSFVVAGALL